MDEFIYVVQMDIPAELEAEFNRIYDEEHIPNILQVPGVRACRRYRLQAADVNGVARYAAVYELDSPNLPQTDAWKARSDLGDWRVKIRPHTMNRAHLTYKRIK